MEILSESRTRPIYYFSRPDQEILDDHILALSGDEDTWLYKIETGSLNGQYQMDTTYQYQQSPPPRDSVDSRTYTRRKHCSLRPSLESVVESPLSNNHSSLGVLSETQLLNVNLGIYCTPIVQLENLEKTSSDSTVSDTKSLPNRIFKLDTPFRDSSAFVGSSEFGVNNSTYKRTRLSSELSDISLPNSLQNCNFLEKSETMTDSLVNFLEKQEDNCSPPIQFQDEGHMTDSLLSLPEANCESFNDFSIQEKTQIMTDSMIDFLMPVNCKPPTGFEDSNKANSVVNVNEENALSTCDITSSRIDYYENIPPNNCDMESPLNVAYSNRGDKLKASGEHIVTYTNSINIARKRNDNGDNVDNFNLTETVGANIKKDLNVMRDNCERTLKLKALLNKYLNVSQDLNGEEVKELNVTKTLEKGKTPIKMNSTFISNNTEINRTFSNSKFSDSSSRQIPSRSSTFNTTFTKLQSESSKGGQMSYTKSTERLNGYGMEDDQTSSASDSSFSSGSTKPRSVDELRSIALQQETNLTQQTSTPTDRSVASPNLDLDLSPIHRLSASIKRNSESRSANSSPVRNPQLSSYPHPISRLQKPSSMESSHQAASLSNIAKSRVRNHCSASSRPIQMRIPQPISRYSIARPSTAPGPTSTAIPRLQASRLPMPRFRGSNIPGLRRGAPPH